MRAQDLSLSDRVSFLRHGGPAFGGFCRRVRKFHEEARAKARLATPEIAEPPRESVAPCFRVVVTAPALWERCAAGKKANESK